MALFFKKSPQMTTSIKIKSFTRDTWYAVNTELPYCTCPRFQRSLKSEGQYGSTCKHLDALGLHVSKPYTSKKQPTFSQALCALVKGIRIRNIEEVVYWMVYMESGAYPDPEKKTPQPAGRFRVARRLLIGSAEDGVSVAVMEKMASNFWKLTKPKDSEFLNLVAEAVRICKIPNWWSDPGGQQYIFQSLKGWNQTMYGMPKKIEHAQEMLKTAINDQDMATALGLFSRMDGIKGADFGSTKQAEWLFEIAKERGHALAMRLCQIHLKQKTALSSDNNFTAQAVWHLAGGKTDVAEAIEPVLAGECYELIEKAKKSWETPHPCPTWALDGIHCAGNDRRFMGMLVNMATAINAYKHYGRLSPEDEWLPQFRAWDGLQIEKV